MRNDRREFFKVLAGAAVAAAVPLPTGLSNLVNTGTIRIEKVPTYHPDITLEAVQRLWAEATVKLYRSRSELYQAMAEDRRFYDGRSHKVHS